MAKVFPNATLVLADRLLPNGWLLEEAAELLEGQDTLFTTETQILPGTILRVNVAQGQAVKEGDVLCVLEAMKMENEIMAPKSGSVAQVVAAKGASVNTGDVLVVIA